IRVADEAAEAIDGEHAVDAGQPAERVGVGPTEMVERLGQGIESGVAARRRLAEAGLEALDLGLQCPDVRPDRSAGRVYGTPQSSPCPSDDPAKVAHARNIHSAGAPGWDPTPTAVSWALALIFRLPVRSSQENGVEAGEFRPAPRPDGTIQALPV